MEKRGEGGKDDGSREKPMLKITYKLFLFVLA
jgi:hypothetical protein